MKKILEVILKYLTYFLALLLILAYLSVHISPAHFWPLAFLGLGFPFILAVNIILLIVWLIKWKKIALLVTVVLLLGFTHIKNTFPNFFREKTGLDVKNENDLKILSYNVRAFNIYEWMNDPNTNKGIFNFIRSEHPDVICIQEFFTSNKTEFSPERYSRVFGETPYNHIEFARRDNPKSGFGIATFSRFPIVNKGVIFRRGGNQGMYTDILFDNDTVRVINCHLQSLNLKLRNYEFLDTLKIRYDEQHIREFQDLSMRIKTAFVKRAGQAKKISEAIERSPHPVVLCGDFNDTPVSYAYHKIKGNMRDAWEVAGRGLGNTYQGILSFRIDYILYQPYFTATDFERVKTQLSDHYPIMTILRRTGGVDNRP